MIKKLKSKIFLLIMISLSIITIGIILLFSLYNYRNTINTSTFFIDRIYGRKANGEFPKEENNIKEKEIDEENENRPKIPTTEIEGFYSFIIKNGEVLSNNDEENENLKEYALKVSNKNQETGIIGNYIYRIEKQKSNEIMVMLVENIEAISHIRILIISAIAGSILSLIIIYIIAKKVSELIVEPVEKTFSKQVEFISDASHELKTPLAVIEANADVLENEVGKNKWLTYIQIEIESMNKLINELLLLAKMENIDDLEERREINISQEIEMIVSMFESMAYEKEITIKTNIQENVKINAKKEDIEHILSTLIDNAIKHTESKNEIIVELNKEKDSVVIDVKNKGEEIQKEEREKIFERFYRVDKARNRNEKRYGLGLAIAKSTVEKYKGTIDVDYKDGYTIFKVKI